MAEPTPTILVVDDEASNRLVVERLLVHAGYVVTVAVGAAEALRIIASHGGFALYIIDVMMPGVRGPVLAQRIRTVDRSGKILYYTAFSAGLFTSLDGRVPDDEAFLQKPVSRRELLDKVSLMLFGHTRGPHG